MKNFAQILSSRRRRQGFTFIELVVAVALTAILIRAMFSVFTGATSLVRMCEEKTNTVYEAAALSDYMANDIGRSPFFSTGYYLYVSGSSVKFQALKINGLPGYVYIEYYLDSSNASNKKIMRRVWNHPTNTGASNVATVANDGEDGTAIAVAYGIDSLTTYFLNDAYRNAYGRLNIDETGPWLSSGTVSGTTRTRAIKLAFTVTSKGDLPAQTYTLVFPIMFN